MFSARKPTRRTANRTSMKRRKASNKTRRLSVELCEPRNLLATFAVTSSVDTGSNVPGELRWAVNQSNITAGPDSIVFQGVSQVELSLGELGIVDDVDINGNTVTPVLLKIVAAPNSRVFNIDNNNVLTSIDVSMNNLEIEGGDVAGFGGGIMNTESLRIARSRVADNHSTEGGGGIANFGELVVTNTDFFMNRADAQGGGGIYNALGTAVVNGSSLQANSLGTGQGAGIYSADAELTVSDSLLRDNIASQVGGGIATDLGATTRILGSTIESNFAGDIAGGVSVGTESTLRMFDSSVVGNGAQFAGGVGVGTRSHVSMTNSVVASNVSTVAGGGIFVDNSTLNLDAVEVENNQSGSIVGDGLGAGLMLTTGAEGTITKSSIVSNGVAFSDATTQFGGGIFVGHSVQLDISDTRINGNSATTGAGIYTDTTSLDDPNNAPAQISISDSSISRNVATFRGGGAYIGPLVALDLKCVTIEGNTAFSGGGMFLQGAPGDFGIDITILDSTIAGNEVRENGGGILSQSGVEMAISNSIISGNGAGGNGGGLHLAELPTGVLPQANTTRIDLSLISGNRAAGADGNLTTHRGGGVFVGDGAALGIDRTTIESNNARASGGGIEAAFAESVTISNSTISGNASARGGGVTIDNSPMDLIQSTVYGNRAGNDGGGVYVTSSIQESVSIRHSTISRNLAAQGAASGTGGGIYVGGESDGAIIVDLSHTIVSGNSANPVGDDEIHDQAASSGFTSIAASFSLVSDNSGTLLPGGNPDPNGNIIGTPGAPISAELGPLSDNGGPTLTMVPMDSSPARNAGSPVSTPFPVGDQRRLPFIRIFDGRIDMGAVEIQPPPPTPDFNGDGVADCNDVDALTAEIVAGNHNPQFDLTRDGLVTRVDLLKWLDDAPDVNGLPITRYLVGDANLDTVVDISDFNIWNANKFTPNTAWCSGNFNADAVIDISDFNIWNANKFTASPSITSCGLFNDGSGSSAFAPPVSDLMDYGTSELEVAAAPSPMRNLTGDVNVSSRSTHSTDTQRDESTLIEDTIAAVFAGWDSII